MSGSQDQKEKLQYSDDNFFGQKITTAQIRFCNDR